MPASILLWRRPRRMIWIHSFTSGPCWKIFQALITGRIPRPWSSLCHGVSTCSRSAQPDGNTNSKFLTNFDDRGRPRTDAYDGRIEISNAIAENAIRPFAVGRKNWLFAGSPKGARASACVYSLVETAKANDLDPFLYLRTLLEDIPGSDYRTNPECIA